MSKHYLNDPCKKIKKKKRKKKKKKIRRLRGYETSIRTKRE
jgi:hypothetical protein